MPRAHCFVRLFSLKFLLSVALLGLCCGAAGACAVCRPRVQAGIHDEAYAANLLLVLLPVGLLLLGGVGLFFADNFRHFLVRRS
jgi:hypothetical protein